MLACKTLEVLRPQRDKPEGLSSEFALCKNL